MKRNQILAILLCICMILGMFCGCSQEPDDVPDTEKPDSTETKPQKQTDPEDPDDDPQQDPQIGQAQEKLLYAYLSNVIIPEKGLADLNAFTWTHEYENNGVEENYLALKESGRHGLVSAVVRDFDLDGNLDLVAFYLTGGPLCETWEPIYGENESLESHIVSMELYVIDGKDVVLSDSYYCLNQIDDASWGPLNVYIEKLEDGIYIDSSSSAEDYSTYGASPRTIFHVENGKFVFDYISGIGYGQGSISTNPNHLMNTTNMDPSEYTFDGRNSDESDGRHVLSMQFTLEDYAAGTMTYTVTDYTQLRDILEGGVESVTVPELPQGGKKPVDPAIEATRAQAMAIANYVQQQSGCVIINVKTSAYNNVATYRFETENYSFLTVRMNGETGKLVGITVSNNKYPVPDEWYNMKDAVIDYPELGLVRSELDEFYGTDVSLNHYTNGVDITGGMIAIRQISSTDFVLEINE